MAQISESLLRGARRYVREKVFPILESEPLIADPIENYSHLLEFSNTPSTKPFDFVKEALSSDPSGEIDIFAYIPQCKYRCGYCPFPVTLDGKSNEDSIRLVKEANNFKDYFNIQKRSVNSFCIGGGTPTLMSSDAISRLVESYRDIFKISKDAQITIECSPDSLTPEKISSARVSGVNRVSLGIQTFDENRLNQFNRKHDSIQAEHAVNLLMSAGFHDVNVDLIRGFPGQTLEAFVNDLSRALELGADSYHVYRMRLPREHTLFSEGHSSERYLEDLFAMQFVSNNIFRDAGYSLHHTSHWTKKQDVNKLSSGNWLKDRGVLGFGWKAYSYFAEGECYNSKKLVNWRSCVDSGVPSLEIACKYSSEEIEQKWIKFALKTLSLPLEQFRARFNKPLFESSSWSKLSCLLEVGVLNLSDANRVLSFSEEGFFVAEEAIRFISQPGLK